ncbi:MAG: hypothetical protein HY929_02205 [Euryarchaeota archaeon]|nr:hypothetical protein [Euryarchaeota archaeon]
MGGIRVYVSDEVEKRFRKIAMEQFGYGRGSISAAAEKAFQLWIAQTKPISKKVEIPEDPVKAIRGLLKTVKKSSVELQHEAIRLRAKKMLS